MNRRRLLAANLATIVAAVLAAVPTKAQQVTGVPGSPSATTTISGKQLPPPDPKFGGVIKEKASESKAWWAPRVVPPKGAPNVLLIMTDDVGFGAPGTFGGVVPTPAMDRIAKSGLRYTNFHSTSLCSPSRAALITGRNHHVAGFGVVGEIATGFPGYDSVIRKENGTIGAILKENGYATSWFGKDHNTPFYQATQAGPFDQWPNGMGFEYFYGFVGGDTSQWQPNLFRNTTAIYPFEGNPGWNLTTAMADEAIQYMKELKEIAPDKPFLVYYVPGGTHAPHHPTPEWIKKISDMHLFDGGWNKLRETIFANQKRLGIMPDERQADPLAEGSAGVGFAQLGREEALHQASRRLRGVPRLHRPRNRPRHPGGRGHGPTRQHPDHLHQRRQRRERGRHAQRHAERVHHLQWRCRAGQGPVPLVRVLGVRPDLPALCGTLVVGDGHAVQVDEAGGVALRRDGPGRGHVVARPHQRRGRHPPPVPPPHRHRSDHPRSDRHPGAGYAQRHQAAPHGRREHGLHVGQGERQRPIPAHHAILRDARQPRHLPRRLGGVHDPGDAPVGTEHGPAARRDHRVQVGTLQRRGGSHRVQRPGCQNAGQAQADAGHLLRRGEEV